MEKYVVFGPIIIFFAFFGLLILGFFLLVFKLVFKAKGQEWTGEVIDKSDVIHEDMDSNIPSHVLSLKVQLENGETHSIAVSRKFFNEVKVGDKLKKDKGSLLPKKIIN